jgi:hypothetical protein
MQRTHKRARAIRGLTVAVLLAVAVATGTVLAGCGEEDIATPTAQIDIAKDMSAKTAIRSIQTGIQAHVATTNALPPRATKDVLGGFVQPWPQNPWTKTDMTEGKDPGNFTYTPGAGTSYTLVVHLSGGKDYAIQ